MMDCIEMLAARRVDFQFGLHTLAVPQFLPILLSYSKGATVPEIRYILVGHNSTTSRNKRVRAHCGGRVCMLFRPYGLDSLRHSTTSAWFLLGNAYRSLSIICSG